MSITPLISPTIIPALRPENPVPATRHSQIFLNRILGDGQGIPGGLLATLPQSVRSDLESLNEEPNPEFFFQQLYSLAQRLEDQHVELSGRIYAALASAGESMTEPALARRAEERLEVLRGGGSWEARLEQFGRNFVAQAMDPAMLIGMGAAGLAFRGARLAALTQLSRGSALVRMPRMGMLAASTLGLVVEVPTFTLASSLSHSLLNRPVDWSAAGIRQSLLQGATMIAAMRVSGAVASGLGRRAFRVPHLNLLSPGARLGLGALQQVGMLTGILTAHALEAQFGLRESSSPSDQLAEGLATLLLFNTAGRVARLAYGPRWATFERNIEIFSSRLSAGEGLAVTAMPRPPVRTGSSTLDTFRNPLLAPMWMIMGAGSVGGGGPISALPPPSPALRLHVRAPEVPGPRRWIPQVATIQYTIGDPVSPGLDLLRSGAHLTGVARGSGGMVVVRGTELAREVLTNRDAWLRFGALVKPPASHPHIEVMLNSLLFMNGENWRTRRRILTPPISKTSVMASMAPTFSRTVEELTGEWPLSDRIDLFDEVMRLTLRNNLRCLIGLEPSQGEPIAKLMYQFTSGILSPSVALTQNIGGGRVIPGTPYARWVEIGNQLRGSLVSVLEHKRANPSGDALGSLVASVDEATGRPLSNDEIIGELVGFYGAGYETTARTLGWTLWLLAHHPHAAERAAQEVAEVLQGRAPERDDLENLNYMNDVIRESQRIIPIVPSTLPRTTMNETRLGGIALPPGSNVTVSIVAQHHDAEVFANPGAFLPERWTDLGRLDPYQYIPFGAGPRRCLGGVFAELQVRSTLALLLQRFSFVPTQPRVDYQVENAAIRPRGALPVQVLPRGGWRESARPSGSIARLLYPES